LPEHQFVKRARHVFPRGWTHHDGPRRGHYDRSEHIEPAWDLDFDDHGPDQRNWLFGKLARVYRPADNDPSVHGYRWAEHHYSGRARQRARSHGTGNDASTPRRGNNHDQPSVTAGGGTSKVVPASPRRPDRSGQFNDDDPPASHAFAHRRRLGKAKHLR
jgi:hypothetical protein